MTGLRRPDALPLPGPAGRARRGHFVAVARPPRHARLRWARSGSRSALRQRPGRAEVWEPVVRHVARALTALETTSQAPGDAYTHLRVEAEIRGEWMRTRAALLGEEGGQRPDRLPRDPLP